MLSWPLLAFLLAPPIFWSGLDPDRFHRLSEMHDTPLALNAWNAVVSFPGGTGFVVDGHRIITCAHVSREAGVSVRARQVGGPPLALIRIGIDDAYDLAVYRFEGQSLGTLPLSGQAARAGDPVFLVSWPPGLEPVFSFGKVLSARDDVLFSDLPTNWGASGSPVLNVQGEVVGVHRAWNEGDDTRLAVPVARIAKILEGP